MKKLILFIPVLLFALVVNAKVTTISPTSPYGDNDNLRKAVYYATAGDEIVLADGTYIEPSSGGYLVLNKSLTIKAAKGAKPVVKLEAYAQLTNSAKVKFEGISFDGSSQGGYDYFFRTYDVSASCLVFENCEFYNIKNPVFRAKSDVHMDSLIINNCYFHNNKKNVVYFEASGTSGRQNCDKFVFTNSTVAKSDSLENYTSAIDISPYGSDNTNAIKVIVDHCTFYDNPTINTDHSAIRPYHLTDVAISNCIFVKGPNQKQSRNATSCYGGTITNCLVYGFDYASKGHRSGPSITGDIMADPLFNDLANDEYTFDGDWTTMSISPARGAATDGSDLGDPRWYSDEVLPSTNFASPYQFVGAKAVLAGKIWYDDVNDYLYGDGEHNHYYGTATWKFHAEKACVVGVAVNINSGNTSSHKLRVEVLDADGNSVSELAEQTSTLPGTLTIPAIGDYKIILHDDQEWSSVKIDNITLSYIGGDVQAMPGTTDIDDAWFSANGTRADGKITYNHIETGCWAKWNIAVASAGTYNVVVNIQNIYGHNYTVEFLKEGSETPINVSEGETKYGHDETLYQVEVGAIALEAGNYVMTVSNAIGDAKLLSTTLAYAGGGSVNLPATLLPGDAVLSDKASIIDGKIDFHPSGTSSVEWAKWNVHTVGGNYTFTVNAYNSTQGTGQTYTLKVYAPDDEEHPLLNETSTRNEDEGEYEFTTSVVNLTPGDYVVKVQNSTDWSVGRVVNVVATYKNGATIDLPADPIPFGDAILSNRAFVENGELHFTDADHYSTISQEWATWNVHAEAGLYNFSVGVSGTNYGNYELTVLDDADNQVYKKAIGKDGTGTLTFSVPLTATGNYVVKLANVNNYADGYLTSFSCAQMTVITLNEADEDNTVITENYHVTNKNIQLTRSFIAGMYNTICLPFSVGDEQLQSVFGNDVELLQMSAATIDDANVLDLTFDAATSIYHGTPYLIKMSHNVENPIFADVEIRSKTAEATSGTAADFIGTFIKQTIPASVNNLYLGTNNLLKFSNNDMPIKGFRAYFQVKTANPKTISRARIVEGNQVVTEIELVDGELRFSDTLGNGALKRIENGQVIILRDGVKYNTLGQRIE